MARTAGAGDRAAVTTRSGLASAKVSPFAMRRVVLTPHDDLRALLSKVGRKGAGLTTEVASRVAGAAGRGAPARV